jgi:hypothetical protein
MNRAAVTGQKRVIAQAVILNVRLEQLAVVLDNDLKPIHSARSAEIDRFYIPLWSVS